MKRGNLAAAAASKAKDIQKEKTAKKREEEAAES